MPGILPVETHRTTARTQFLAKRVLPYAREQVPTASCDLTGLLAGSICHMLIRQGFDKTLEYFGTFSVFSVLSED